MKLPEHVKTIRELISTAFGNQFARLRVTAEKQRDTAGLDAVGQSARAKLDAIIASHIEETGSYAGAFDKALDEYTFTLFNREQVGPGLEKQLFCRQDIPLPLTH